MFRRGDRIEVKTQAQLQLMRRAGLVVADALDAVRDCVRPGVTTDGLDRVAAGVIERAGASASFLGYHGYPKTICVSVNDEIVHGIPGSRVLEEGDVVSVDCGAIVQGWHGDAAFSMGVGDVRPEHVRLIDVTEASLWAGLARAVVGGRLSDIGHAVETSIRGAGEYGIVEEYVGHGIGSAMHMEPSVANYGRPGHGPRLVAGMALAVEPMVTTGARYTRVLDDEWTVVTADGGYAAHWEHTVALTPDGPWVTTAHDGGTSHLG
jgi:methionyl aminopeptidase